MFIEKLHLLIPSQEELYAALLSWDSTAYTNFMGYLCFLLIVALPLTQIDRRHYFSAMLYVVFCSAAGVMFTMAIPHKLIEPHESSTRFLLVTAFALLATTRWLLTKKVKIKSFDSIEEEKNKQKT